MTGTRPSARQRRRARAIPLLTSLLLFLAGGWLVVSAPTAAADGPTTFSNTASIAIPGVQTPDPVPAGPASPYPSNITVSGMAGAVTKVTVTFHNLTHPIASDIDAMVVAPTGANLVVFSDASNANSFSSASNATLTFDDAAASTVPNSPLGIPNGSYKPTNNSTSPADSFSSPAPAPSSQTTLAGAFTGINPNGTWQLFVVDDASGDVGSMAGGWSLTITTEVAASATTTTVTSSDTTSFTGDSVTFTATVRVGATPVTSGTVQFADGATNVGGAVALNSSGVATFSTSALTEGTHEIRATYSGATGFLTSNGTVSQRVDNRTVVTARTYCNPGTITVAQQGTASPYPSNIFVSGLNGQVTKITATLNGLSHTEPTDIDIMLAGPSATTNLVLLSDAGGNNVSDAPAVSNQTITFDDAAPSGVPIPLVGGTYRPTDNDPEGQVDTFQAPAPTVSSATTLATFNGASPNGTWSLWVVDDASGDSGSIGGWCLTITSQSATTTALTSSDNPSNFGDPVTFTATVASGGNPVTTGFVQFSDGGSPLGGPVALSAAGVASFTTSSLSVGTHPIGAAFAGTDDFVASSASPLSQVVDKIPTATVLTSTLNPSNVGDEVTFTATVTADGDPVTEGTVQFSDDGTNLGPQVALSAAGVATFTTSTLVAGTHPITASYSGTATLATSDDDLDQQVDKFATVTDLSVDIPNSVVGQAITFTAVVTSEGNPVGEGSVQFSDGATPLGAPVALPANGTATLTTDALLDGTHTITATFQTTDRYAESSDSLDQVVSKTDTVTQVTSSVNPSRVGQEVTFTAVVEHDGSPVTTGTIQFSDGATPLGSPVALDVNGEATYSTTALTLGTHTITATYSGTEAFEESSDTVDQVVALVQTGTTLSSAINPSLVDQDVTFTATVTENGIPVTSGTVQFSVGGTNVGGPVSVSADGTATLTTAFDAAGTYQVVATYSGTGVFEGSVSAAVEQVVQQAVTLTTITSSVNPSLVDQDVTFTATVTAGGIPVTVGTVQFSDDGTNIGAPVALAPDGTATLTTSFDSEGTYPITATYSGTPVFEGSASDPLDQVVEKAVTSGVLTISPASPTVGELVTFTMVVSASIPPTGGTVQFEIDGSPFGTPVPLGAGSTAATSTADLPVGPHTITATYSGTTVFTGVSDTESVAVGQIATSTTVATSGSPSTFGSDVTFTATVSANGSPVTTGEVQFFDNDVAMGISHAVAADGTVSITADLLSVGTHTIRADYLGTTNLAESTGTVTQVVDPAATLTVLTSSAAGNESNLGDSVTFTATVTADGDPVTSGAVTFSVDGTEAQAAADVALDGTVTFTTTSLAAGAGTILASYGGTDSYLQSSDQLIHTVNVVADAGGPYSLAEGDSLTLDGSGSSPGATYEWDLDDDGVFGDVTGASPTLTWDELQSFGINDGLASPLSYPIALQVTSGAVSETASTTIDVTNTAPLTVLNKGLPGGLTATVGVPFMINVGADDPSSADMAALFTYTVNWGDGSPEESVDGPADPPVTHTYTAPGQYDATFTATDKDGDEGDGTTVQVNVQQAQTNPPSDPDDGGSLPSTGASFGPLPVVIGVLLLAGGAAALIMAARRRRLGQPGTHQ